MKHSTALEYLFEPVQIGAITIKNRIVMAPMGTCLANENGAVTNALIDFYVKRAKGGVGLIIVENASIHVIRNISRLGIYDDQLITGLKELVEKIKESSSNIKVFIQLNQVLESQITDPAQPASRKKRLDPTISDLSYTDIRNFVEGFIEGASRAKIAGFDGIEVHGAHRYLINQFLSPFFNHRSDQYGGTPEKNMRLAIEIIRGIRAEVGLRYPIMFRQNGSDFVQGGLSVNNAIAIARRIQEAGVDALHVSAGIPKSPEWTSQPMGFEPGCLVPLAREIKKIVSIPVVAVGKINDPFLANSIIQERKADMVALGRGLLADPEFPRKTQEGKTQEIKKCIACRFCVERIHKGFRVRCKINPTVGREKDFPIVTTQQAKSIMVIGGGPAGLEAASIAKRRGHNVKLFERQKTLGGQLLLAKVPPFKTEIVDLIKNLEIQVKQLGITISLNFPVTAEFIKTEEPDIVIFATGGKPLIPDMQGVDQDNVVTYDSILNQTLPLEGRTIVIAGGGEIGCECADYIRTLGQDVQITIIEMTNEIATEMELVHRKLLLERLAENNIKILLETRLMEISRNGVVVERAKKREFIYADLIVLAVGNTPNDELPNELNNLNTNCYKIGDCSKIGNIEDAMLAAWKTALIV